MITFDDLVLGEAYDRPHLAKLWGYTDWHAIGRGVVTPVEQKVVVLFVTKKKQAGLVQYEDHFEGDTLFMEGERGATAANNRLKNARANGDMIVLFYRERHHTPFIYYGAIELVGTSESDAKIVFEFSTTRSDTIASNALATEAEAHGGAGYEADEEGRQHRTQHVSYERSRKNRAAAIRLHGTKCKACGFDFNAVYGPELARDYIEIHHVESIATGVRHVDASTDLVPLCANCHAMVHRNRHAILTLAELKNIMEGTKQEAGRRQRH
jgi:5-methylcytosine-specific restriction enzyme A